MAMCPCARGPVPISLAHDKQGNLGKTGPGRGRAREFQATRVANEESNTMPLTTFVVPPPPLKGVVRDYAGGLGFEAAGSYVLPPLDLLQLAAIAERVSHVSLED